ncbi:hypothetical protein SAMN05216603_1011 [Pseudomonas benzenivorans]|nr:hypothetical protein [Pseudomonas benzenivorans]SDG25242.1 hypothetical protein SAMN05216603_1011 [Pseudomonas benzenivorans]
MPDTPDLTWCSRISAKKNLSIRCPFATAKTCPRYYQSLSLMGDIGSTKIPEKEDKKLLKKWSNSDLWPLTGEYASSIFKANTKFSMACNFCPEVMYDRFGYFCTSLSSYADEIDADAAHKSLSRSGVESSDPRWQWASVTAQHYTECPVYSVLQHRALSSEGKVEPWWRQHLAEIVVGIVVAIATTIITKALG